MTGGSPLPGHGCTPADLSSPGRASAGRIVSRLFVNGRRDAARPLIDSAPADLQPTNGGPADGRLVPCPVRCPEPAIYAL